MQLVQEALAAVAALGFLGAATRSRHLQAQSRAQAGTYTQRYDALPVMRTGMMQVPGCMAGQLCCLCTSHPFCKTQHALLVAHEKCTLQTYSTALMQAAHGRAHDGRTHYRAACALHPSRSTRAWFTPLSNWQP